MRDEATAITSVCVVALIIGSLMYSCAWEDRQAGLARECISETKAPKDCAKLFGIKTYPMEEK